MVKPFVALLLLLSSVAAQAQQRCADPAVTDVKIEDITQQRGPTSRFRVTATVTNVGDAAFTSLPGAETSVSFGAQGSAKQVMANQPLRDLAAGESTAIIFEADVARGSRTLPAWNNMPFPTEVCGEVALNGRAASLPECSVKNNRLCKRP